MKANKAPEKIYISPLSNHSDGYVGVAWDEPHKTMVEYTRTDAFIEKACDYLQKNIWRIIYEENEFRQRFVTDFKNYMKRE